MSPRSRKQLLQTKFKVSITRGNLDTIGELTIAFALNSSFASSLRTKMHLHPKILTGSGVRVTYLAAARRQDVEGYEIR